MRRILRFLLWVMFPGLLLLDAGCLVGPSYHAPKIKIPGQYEGLSQESSEGSASLTTSAAASLTQWWKAFRDPELDSLISQAIQSNLTLQQARQRILQARAARIIAGAGLWPTVNGSVSNTTSGSNLISSGAGASGSSTHNLFQTGLDAAWELDFFGGLRRGVEAATANLQASIEDSRDVTVTLTAEVALDYVDLRGLQQQIAIAKKNLETQRETADITHERFNVGFASGLDTANADAQVATTQSQIPVLEAAKQQAIYSISVLLGRQPTALLAELSPAASIPATPPEVPVGLPSDLLERRPDIRRAEAELHAATAQVGVARADLFPKFNLTGSGGLEKLAQGSLAGLFESFWSAGPSLAAPIYNHGSIRANIRAQQAAEQEALIAYHQTVLTALQDVESALIAYNKDQQHRVALADAVKSSRTAVNLSRKLYTAGQTEFLNLLTAERDLYTGENGLAQADQTIDTDLIALYKALGGGWQP